MRTSFRAAALAALIAEGLDLAAALPIANAAAALCTQTVGAIPAMPARAAVMAALAAPWSSRRFCW